LSKKEKLGKRVKNILNITIPLIFSTLERIETISNTMDLRGFGKEKKRTWYAAKPLKRGDIVALSVSVLILLATIAMSVFVNHSKFYNPFV
jgi:energy-coupling factor transport system permease protein